MTGRYRALSRGRPHRRAAVNRLRRSYADASVPVDDAAHRDGMTASRRCGKVATMSFWCAARPNGRDRSPKGHGKPTAIGARSRQGRRSRPRSGLHGRMLRIRLDLTASTAMAAGRWLCCAAGVADGHSYGKRQSFFISETFSGHSSLHAAFLNSVRLREVSAEGFSATRGGQQRQTAPREENTG
jgi:hypothetical protein